MQRAPPRKQTLRLAAAMAESACTWRVSGRGSGTCRCTLVDPTSNSHPDGKEEPSLLKTATSEFRMVKADVLSKDLTLCGGSVWAVSRI